MGVSRMDSFNQFKIDLRVNNQITITRQRLAKKKEKRYENYSTPKLSQDEINCLIERYAVQEGLQTEKKWYDPQRRIVTAKKAPNGSKISPFWLDIMHKFQEDHLTDKETAKPKKKGYGATPSVKNFSRKAGQKLRECGGAIDILCDRQPEKCRVITLTLPASGEAAYKALSDWSGYATNRLLQTIRDTEDDTYYWFYVWEHQKRGALHMHLCLYHEDRSKSKVLGDAIVSKWRDILCDIGRRSGVDLLFSKGFNRRVESDEMQSNNQEMRKGCGAYFSKYAAKTSRARDRENSTDINTVNARLYPPSSFWGRSQNLAKLCEFHSFHYKFEGIYGEESESLQREALEVLSQFDIVLQHSFPFKKELQLKGNGTLTICEGFSHVFYVKPEVYQILLAHFRFLYRNSPSSAIIERAKKRGVTVESHTQEYF